MGNKSTKEMSQVEKNSLIIDIVNQIDVLDVDELIRKVLTLNLKEIVEIQSFFEAITENAVKRHRSSSKHVQIIKKFHDSSSNDVQKSVKFLINQRIHAIVDHLWIISSYNQNLLLIKDKAQGIGIFIGNLYIYDLVDATWIKMKINYYASDDVKRNIRKFILETIKEKIVKERGKNNNSCVVEIFNVMKDEKLIEGDTKVIKNATIEEILRQIQIVDTSLLMVKVAKLYLDSDDNQMKIFAEKIIENVEIIENSSIKHAKLIKMFCESLTVEKERKFKNIMKLSAQDTYNRKVIYFDWLKIANPKTITEFAKLFTALFNYDLIDSEFMMKMLKTDFRNEEFKNDFRQMIFSEVKDRVVSMNEMHPYIGSDGINKLYKKFVSEGFIQEVEEIPDFEKKILQPSASENKSTSSNNKININPSTSISETMSNPSIDENTSKSSSDNAEINEKLSAVQESSTESHQKLKENQFNPLITQKPSVSSTGTIPKQNMTNKTNSTAQSSVQQTSDTISKDLNDNDSKIFENTQDKTLNSSEKITEKLPFNGILNDGAIISLNNRPIPTATNIQSIPPFIQSKLNTMVFENQNLTKVEQKDDKKKIEIIFQPGNWNVLEAPKQIANLSKNQPLISEPKNDDENVQPFFANNQNRKYSTHTQSRLVREFDEYLQTIKNGNKNIFNLSKFNATKEVDRKECVLRLIEFGIKNTACADKVAKFTQSFMTYNIKSSKNNIIKDVAIFLTEICDEKLKILKNECKNWIEIEGLGIFLGNLYALNLQKARIMYEWLDKVKNLAVENDLALKMFLKVFKIVQREMKRKDVLHFNKYLKNVAEFINNCPERIPKIYENILNDVKGISKSQNSANLTSNAQNIRSLSVASNLSDISTASANIPKISTGAIPKTLPIKTATTEICTAFQKILNNFEATNKVNFNTKFFDNASDAAIQGCALLLIEQSLLNQRKIQNYAFTTLTIYESISDVSKQMKFKKFLNDYILAEMNRCLKVEKAISSNWDRVSKLNIFICELYKLNISETTTVTIWLDRLQIMSSSGCVEAKNEYDICLEKTTERIFQIFLKSIQERRKINYPNKILNDASDGRVKVCANNFIQISVVSSENCKIFVDSLRNIILPSFTNEEKKNVFVDNTIKYLINNIEAIINTNAPCWNRVAKINPFICELYNQGLIDASILKYWQEKMAKFAKTGVVEAKNVLKILNQRTFDKNLIYSKTSKKEIEIADECKEDLSKSTINEFKLLLGNLNKYNNEELFTAIEAIEINSNENLHIIAEFFFKSIMESNEDPVIFVFIAKMIDKNISNEFDFRLALVDLIIQDFNTKSSQDVKNVSNSITFIGKFYNEDWIDFAQIQMCLRKLTTAEALMNFQLFYKLIKIISIKLITTGDGVQIKEFYDVLNEGDENENAVTDLKYLKVLRTLESIWENSKIIKSNFDQFKKILRNLSEKNVKESIEKLKLMKINCDRKYSRAFIDAFMDSCENVESFVKILAEIERNQDLDIEGQKTSFMPYVLTEIEDLMNYNSVPKPKLYLMKIIIFICSLYNENMIEVEGVKSFLNDLIEISLEDSFAALEFLISSVGIKFDSEDEKLLDEILENLKQKSTAEDKKKIEKLIESRKTNNEITSNDFNHFIVNLQNIPNLIFLATQMKPKILAREETMKQFAHAVYNCCINDTNIIELTMKFCECLIDNEKFKEIFSIFIQSKLISIKNEDKMKFNTVKLVANCYKIDLIDDETFKPWLSAKILDNLTYNQLSEINEIIVVKNSAEFSYLDDLMHEKFIVLCEEIKSDLKNVKISIDKKENDDEILEHVD